jgi:hypothetical protein
MTAITNGIRVVKEAMVNFAKAIGSLATDLFQSAARGVVNFFRNLFGSGPRPVGGNCDGCTTPFDWWFMKQDRSDYFFIRILENQNVGIGLDDNDDQEASNGLALAAKPYYWYDDTQWWRVSTGHVV